MISHRRLFPHRLPVPSNLRSAPFLAAVWSIAAVALLIGCGGSTMPATPQDYEATVQLLLPTAEPTEPPTATAEPTATSAPSPTATAEPTIALPPPPSLAAATATVRPTYTPRPPPTQPGSGERQPAILFQAQMLDGSEVSLPDTFGTPTLLAFWAPW